MKAQCNEEADCFFDEHREEAREHRCHSEITAGRIHSAEVCPFNVHVMTVGEARVLLYNQARGMRLEGNTVGAEAKEAEADALHGDSYIHVCTPLFSCGVCAVGTRAWC